MSILVLEPGGAQLDCILGKIHPARLALAEAFLFTSGHSYKHFQVCVKLPKTSYCDLMQQRGVQASSR
jgi:hypothetical protein